RGAESVESYKAHIEQSMHELRMLNSCRHDNILPVYGYCIKGGDPCLVYQLMPNGSLEDRLLSRNGTKPLTWPQRHNIAEGTARGLHFLHTNKPKPFIHGDVKRFVIFRSLLFEFVPPCSLQATPHLHQWQSHHSRVAQDCCANILLDSNFEPRIGDFGLAQVGPAGQYTHMTVSRVHGTRPYLPDEFLRSKGPLHQEESVFYMCLTATATEERRKEEDVTFVMFELATGLRPYDELRQHKFLVSNTILAGT
ncbi:unnamed protein product, partial [Timema podura]|nr:unnamed protein product [Timema podura]